MHDELETVNRLGSREKKNDRHTQQWLLCWTKPHRSSLHGQRLGCSRVTKSSWHGRAGCAILPSVVFAELAYHSNPNTFLSSEAHRGLRTAQCITWSLPILDLGHGTSRRTCSARRQAVMLSMAASERREHRNSTLIPGEGREEV